MAPVIQANSKTTRPKPGVLIVDDEPGLLELVHDVVGSTGECRLFNASTLAQAQRILAREKIDLLVADLHLPDGDGMSLVPTLRQIHPHAATVVITGDPSVQRAVNAIRAGAVDFVPKPFSADQLRERIAKALKQQELFARSQVRMNRLRSAVKKLNSTRHMISKKVDLLCNDLVSAYGELSKQLDTIRLQEGFRNLLESATDLEQMLCHAMDWILRQCGYCNVAVWLASEEREFELGAYMKFTIPGEPELTDAMRAGLLPLINREGSVHLFGAALKEQLTPIEFNMLAGQEIVGCNCTYLGESLASLILFRDDKSPFTDRDIALLRAVSPIFAVALANSVRRADGEDDLEDDSIDGSIGGSLLDDDEDSRSDRDRDSKRSKQKNDADWWKRGEPPPF